MSRNRIESRSTHKTGRIVDSNKTVSLKGQRKSGFKERLENGQLRLRRTRVFFVVSEAGALGVALAVGTIRLSNRRYAEKRLLARVLIRRF